MTQIHQRFSYNKTTVYEDTGITSLKRSNNKQVRLRVNSRALFFLLFSAHDRPWPLKSVAIMTSSRSLAWLNIPSKCEVLLLPSSKPCASSVQGGPCTYEQGPAVMTAKYQLDGPVRYLNDFY